MGTMKFVRRLGASLLTAVLLLAVTGPSAQAAEPEGVGSATGSTSLLSLVIGESGNSPLELRLIGEDGVTNIDTVAGIVRAAERLVGIELSSTLLPGLALATPPVESSTTGAEDVQGTQLVDLAALSAGLPIPGLLSGSIQPVSLRSVVDATGAHATLSGALADIGVLAGLLSLDTLNLDLGSRAIGSEAAATRGVSLAELDVLNLQGLLSLLGIALEDLPLDAALGLLGTLGLPLPGGAADVGDLDATIETLQATLGSLVSQAIQLAAQNPVCDALAPILGQLGITCDLVAATLADLTDTVNGIIDQLQALLVGIVDSLAGASLLSLSDLEIGVLAAARDSVATSAADVVASVGDITVAGITLPGLNIGATVQQVAALANQISSTLNGLLATIDPALGDLLTVELLDQTTSVAPTATGIQSLASVTGLRIQVTPPDICALLGRLGGPGSLGGLLGANAITPILAPVADILSGLGLSTLCSSAGAGRAGAAGLVDGVATALTQPLTIEALSVSEAAVYRMPNAPAPTPNAPTPTSLPRTGSSDGALLAVLAAAGLAAALGARRALSVVRVESE